jgi:hypothetical protein
MVDMFDVLYTYRVCWIEDGEVKRSNRMVKEAAKRVAKMMDHEFPDRPGGYWVESKGQKIELDEREGEE